MPVSLQCGSGPGSGLVIIDNPACARPLQAEPSPKESGSVSEDSVTVTHGHRDIVGNLWLAGLSLVTV
jgi:hypothetical protein